MADFPTTAAAFGQAKFHKTANLCESQLGGAITGLPSTFTVLDATKFTTWPTATFAVRIRKTDGTNNEVVYVSSRSSNTLTIGARALGGTSSVDHTSDEICTVVETSEFIQYLVGEVIAMQGWAGFLATMVHASVTTTPYTATSSDAVIPVDATAASATVNLPTASGIKGRMYVIIKTDASINTVTIDGSAAETIGGATTKVLETQNAAAIVYSDGTNWLLVSSGSAGGGGLTWTEVTGTSQTASVDNGYIANNASLVTITLPTTAAVGKVVAVQGEGAGKWKVAQVAGQTIHTTSGDTTTGTGGSLSAGSRYDSVELICITANTDWAVRSHEGTLVGV